MSNNLLFSAIPRNTQQPVTSQPSIGALKKEQHSEQINEKNKEGQQQKHEAEHQAMQNAHENNQPEIEAHTVQTNTDEANSNNDSGTTDTQKLKHLDIYI